MSRFVNKVALVTGAASGVGRAISRKLANEGCAVALVDLNTDSLAEEFEYLKKKNMQVSAHDIDLSDVSQFEQLMENVIKEHGQLNALFNNAGVIGAGKIGELDPDTFDQLTAIHLKAPIFLTQAAMPFLSKTQGAVVNTSSASGTTTFPLLLTMYGTLKGGLAHFTKYTAAHGFRHSGVRANAIAPGVIRTGMTENIYFDEEVGNLEMQQCVRNAAPVGGGIIDSLILSVSASFLPESRFQQRDLTENYKNYMSSPYDDDTGSMSNFLLRKRSFRL
ncbi:Oidioi.mRNA.OKI2018_I69.chr1.g1002.t1.cds [Oikopleura dioica]|uniref:Oidioi.mRNA.OKI2018_I69.chr1.g1002.t1.cds n=1 Tax=Oikopleura dioica TaxID=34765 RepID=A0ABN7SQ82_OIKDI|nr:Oidioi.mRNA.OKI2018_I69.chr1.g1002.t1.cds [Oikopleura dioica]